MIIIRREAEQQEQQSGDRVLDADDLVVLREDVLLPEPQLVMRMIVRVRVPVRRVFRGRHLVQRRLLPS